MALSRHKITHGSSWPWKINIGHTESRAERLGSSHHFSQATCKMLKTLMSNTHQQETLEEAGGFSSIAAHALWNFLIWCIEFVMHQGGSQRMGILKARTPSLARVNWLGVCPWDFFSSPRGWQPFLVLMVCAGFPLASSFQILLLWSCLHRVPTQCGYRRRDSADNFSK